MNILVFDDIFIISLGFVGKVCLKQRKDLTKYTVWSGKQGEENGW